MNSGELILVAVPNCTNIFEKKTVLVKSAKVSTTFEVMQSTAFNESLLSGKDNGSNSNCCLDSLSFSSQYKLSIPVSILTMLTGMLNICCLAQFCNVRFSASVADLGIF